MSLTLATSKKTLQ